MKFSYYNHLSKKNKATYLKSESINLIEINSVLPLRRCLQGINVALKNENKERVELLSQHLTNKLCNNLLIKALKVKVLSVRPKNRHSELYGMYEPSFSRAKSMLTIWMRTSTKKQPVRFKTFLRTLMHELCHHYDYEHLGFSDSFHTIGFFNRESSLYKQVIAYYPE